MTSILLVSATQSLCARMPEVLSDRNLGITVIGSAQGQLLGSPFVDSYEAVAETPADFVAAIIARPELIDRGVDWVLYDNDELIRELARGSWPDEVKRRCLPAVTVAGLDALGSKIGQQVLAEKAGVPTPETRVVHDVDDVTRALREMPGPMLLKSDVGGGGTQVWPLRDAHDLSRVPRLSEQLPALVQEPIQGELISVEPLYRRGRLLGLQYSRMERTMRGGFGPSTVRRFLDPPDDVLEILSALGEAGGLNGFGNLTFIRCPRRQQHLLIECDMRMNTCAQYGPQLGVDWGALLAGDDVDGVATTSLGPAGRVIHVYPRAIGAAISEVSWGHLRPWVMRAHGTWDARNRRDPVVNAAERAEVLGPQALTRHLLHDPLRATWLRLPPGLRQSMEGRRWKHKALRAMGIYI